MKYYLYKDGDLVVGYHQTNQVLPPPAIEVTKEEFIELGLYTEPPLEESNPETPSGETQPSVWDEMAAAYKEGVQGA